MSAVPWYVLSVIREACVLPEEERTEEQIETWAFNIIQPLSFLELL